MMDKPSTSFVRIAGTVIELGGDRFVMPPLSLGAVEQMGDRFVGLGNGGGMSFKDFGPLIDLIHTALKRNYPDIERSDVASGLDLGNVESVFQALMKTSGLVREVPIEEMASGEAAAATAG